MYIEVVKVEFSKILTGHRQNSQYFKIKIHWQKRCFETGDPSSVWAAYVWYALYAIILVLLYAYTRTYTKPTLLSQSWYFKPLIHPRVTSPTAFLGDVTGIPKLWHQLLYFYSLIPIFLFARYVRSSQDSRCARERDVKIGTFRSVDTSSLSTVPQHRLVLEGNGKVIRFALGKGLFSQHWTALGAIQPLIQWFPHK